MRKRRLQVAVAVVVAGGALAVVAAAVADWGGGRNNIRESLSGFEEVPVVSTDASGDFKASIDRSGGAITYELSYADTTGDVSQAHIHLGQKSVNGGVSAWLCGNPNPPAINPPAGTQPCPPAPATISGTITAENVVGPANQGIAAGEFEELVRAIRAGVTYVNVHSATFPGGEIRSQLGTHHGDDW